MAIFVIDTQVSQVKQYAVEAETSAEAVEELELLLKSGEVEEFSATDSIEEVIMSRGAYSEEEAVALIKSTLNITKDDDIWTDEMVESMILWYDDEA